MWIFFMEYLKAFIVGGIICALVQVLMEKTKLLPGRIMVLLVCSGVVLGALGLYKPLIDFAGAGATVPLSGFGYLLWTGVKDAINNEGFIGIFKGGLTASAVGIAGALVMAFLAAVIFKPKTRK